MTIFELLSQEVRILPWSNPKSSLFFLFLLLLLLLFLPSRQHFFHFLKRVGIGFITQRRMRDWNDCFTYYQGTLLPWSPCVEHSVRSCKHKEFKWLFSDNAGKVGECHSRNVLLKTKKISILHRVIHGIILYLSLELKKSPRNSSVMIKNKDEDTSLNNSWNNDKTSSLYIWYY